MPKKTIAADALNFLIGEKLRLVVETANPPSVAVVPHPTEGWTTLIPHADMRRHPELAGHLNQIEKALKRHLDLKNDD
jgi:hypothetical protein